MPIAFPSIRANSNLNILTIAPDSAFATTYPIVLGDKNYTSITTLIADINAQYTTTYPTYVITMALNSNGNIQISSTNSSIFSGQIYVKPSNLSYLLGFRSGLDTLATRSIVAGAVYRLSLDDYINIYLPNFSTNAVNTNGTYCSFKVPMNTTNGVIYYRNEVNPPYVNVGANYHFNSMTIIITDKFGYSLSSYGIDYSMSLEFSY